MSLIAELSKKAATIGAPPMRPVMAPYQLINGTLVPIQQGTDAYLRNGIDINDTVYSVIKIILDKVKIAPWAVYKIIDESSLKSLESILSKNQFSPSDFAKAVQLHTKAFELVRSPGKLGELLKYPNDYQTFNDLVNDSCGYKLLTGNKFIWADLLEGGANKGKPNKLWVMPSQHIQLIVQRGFPAKILGYRMPILGLEGRTEYKVEEILHEKETNYGFDISGSQLLGTSPLKAALKRINNSNSALDVSTAKFQNGGPEAIIFVDDPRYTNEEGLAQANAVKGVMINEYSSEVNAGKFATSGFKIGVERLGYTHVELDIIRAEINNIRFLCNIFGVPSQLLNDPENKSFNNSKEGEKALTTRCALPLLNSMKDNLNRKFHIDWGMDKSWIIDYDLSCYSELQTDTGELIKWLDPLAKITGMPFNRILDLAGQPTIDNPLWDEPWVRTEQGVPLSQWVETNVDDLLNSGND